jgi:hypothetical protein
LSPTLIRYDPGATPLGRSAVMEVLLEAEIVRFVPPRVTSSAGLGKPSPVMVICVPAVFSVTLVTVGAVCSKEKTGSR